MILSPRLDLQELERRAWLSDFQDGLFDIFLGLMRLAGALDTGLSYAGVRAGVRIPAYLPIVGLACLSVIAGKYFITLPRMGRVAYAKVCAAVSEWRFRGGCFPVFPDCVR